MRLNSTKLTITAASFFALAASASASDLGIDSRAEAYEPAPVQGVAVSGFYIKGDLGIATGDRSVSRTIGRETGDFELVEGEIPEGSPEGFVPDSIRMESPLFIDTLSGSENGDFDDTVFGGEVSYLHRIPGQPLGFEIAGGVTFYDNNETTSEFVDAYPTVIGGTGTEGMCAFCVGDPAGYSQSGFLSVDRKYDIDLVGRLHYFVNDRLAVNAGGGLSWAKANIKGGSTGNYDGAFGVTTEYDTAFDKDDSSLGYVVTAGVTYWATDRITLGLSYDYKQHDFDASAGGTTDGDSTYRRVGDDVGVEDELHTIKARLGFKLN